MHAAYTWLIADALDRAGIKLPLPQADLRLRSVFGHEGDDALHAMGFPPPAQGRGPARRKAPNDAAEDIMAPPDEPEPPRPSR